MTKPRLALSIHAGLVRVGDFRTKFLTGRELQMIRYLDDHRDQVIEATELYEALFGVPARGSGDANVAHVIVHRVRQKIEPNPRRPQYLLTVSKRGYMLESDSRERR